MNVKDFDIFCRDVEASIPLHLWTYEDFDLWPIIRCHLAVTNIGTFKTKNAGTQIRKNILRLLYSAYYSLRSMVFGKVCRSDYLFISTSANYRSSIRGQLIDYYLDPIRMELESRGQSSFFTGIYCEGIFKNIPSRVFFCDLFRYFSLLRHLNVAAWKVEGWDKLEEIASQHEIHIDERAIQRRIVAEYSFAIYYEKILNVVNPKACFVACYAGKWGIIRACKRKGVPVVDVQHGVQGSYHWEYNRWGHLYNTLPNYFWCWGADEVLQIQRWNGCAIEAGHPMLRAITQGLISVGNRNGEKRLLVSLQKGFDWNFVDELVSKTKKKIYLRLHPNMDGYEVSNIQRFASVHSDQIDYRWASEAPLFEVISSSYAHLTISSSVVIECSYFNVPSFCLAEEAMEMYPSLVRNNFLCRVSTIAEFICELDKRDASQDCLRNNIFNINDIIEFIK